MCYPDWEAMWGTGFNIPVHIRYMGGYQFGEEEMERVIRGHLSVTGAGVNPYFLRISHQMWRLYSDR